MRRVLLLGGALALAGACKTPTKMSIEVVSDVGYRADMAVAITVDAPEKIETAAPRVVVRAPWSAGGSLGDVVALPSSDRDDLAVRVVLATGRDPSACTATDATGCVVVRRRLRFTRGASTRARIVLRPACLGIYCDPTSSCAVDGTCGSLTSDEGAGDGGVPAIPDAGDPYAAQVLADRPRHYYRLDESEGATVVHDTMGRADGTVSGGVKLGVTGALEVSANTGAFFDGTGAIFVARAEDARGASTVEAWMRLDRHDAPSRTIVERVDVVGGTTFGFQLAKPSDQSAAFSVFRDGRTFVSALGSFRFAGYSHVVAVTRGDAIQVYVDGHGADPTTTDAVASTPLVGPLAIGGSKAGNTPFFGAIDEVAIYDYPLDAAQIARHFAAGNK